MTDALNNEIVIGDIYGYSNNRNGFTDIVIGKLLKITPKNLVTLEIISRKRAVYTKDPELVISGVYKTNKVSCKANMLFPVKIEK